MEVLNSESEYIIVQEMSSQYPGDINLKRPGYSRSGTYTPEIKSDHWDDTPPDTMRNSVVAISCHVVEDHLNRPFGCYPAETRLR